MSDRPINPPGTTQGRVVFYTPHLTEIESLGVKAGETVVGRISRFSPDGAATLHLDVDVPSDEVGTCLSFDDHGPVTSVVRGHVTTAIRRGVWYDPDGKPSTWRFPPRV